MHHNILVVDDEPDILEVLEGYLDSEDRTILKAQNGKEALAIIKKNDISLIITDLVMPEMDGLTLCESLSHEHHPAIKIVLSSHGGKGEVRSAFQFHVFDYIDKPITKEFAEVRVVNALQQFELNYMQVNLLSLLCDGLGIGKDIDFEELSFSKRMEYLNMITKLIKMKFARGNS